MKTLFLHYSFEGNCRALSEHMAGAVGGAVQELVPVEDKMPRGAVMKYLVGGRSSFMREIAALRPLSVDPDAYDLLFVGGPVWAWGMAPAVRGFLDGRDWRGKRFALFAMHRGGPGGVAKSMADLVRSRGGEVVGTDVFVDLRRRDAEATRAKAAEWAATMIGRAEKNG